MSLGKLIVAGAVIVATWHYLSPVEVRAAETLERPAHDTRPPISVSDIPLAKCSPDQALNANYLRSVDRQANSSREILRATGELEKLANSLPHVNVPVSKLMNATQSAQFTRLSVAIRIGNLNQLAESRVQRDDAVMIDAADALEIMRKGGAELKTKNDPSGEGAGLLGLMRKVLTGDSKDSLPNPNPNICSIDLALFKEEQQSMRRLANYLRSPKMHMWLDLRRKYKVPGVLDPQKLPSPDKEKAIWLQKAIGLPAEREVLAARDWEGLRWYLKASNVEYKSLRNDIINGAGSKNYNYGTTINGVYASADPTTRDSILAWRVIEKNVPSEQEQLMDQFQEMQKREAQPNLNHGKGR
ncbi:MAG TPA: hypothetical protein VMV25_07335 [Steroidobacteraceae bacterium]|nr:hypothetical protein [Steroidobacteraceae bacterium]